MGPSAARRTHHRRLLAATALPVLVLALAACGGGTAAPTPTDVATAPADVTPASEPSQEPEREPEGVYLATAVELHDWLETGRILASPDGRTWTTAWEGPGTVAAVGTSPVGVAGALAAVWDVAGTSVLSSVDGLAWSAAATVPGFLTAFGYGDGAWIAVGDRSFAEEGGAGDASGGAIYRSADGVRWDRVATTSPYDNTELTARSGGFLFQTMESVAHVSGRWVATARECTEQTRECLAALFVSDDGGASWERTSPSQPLGSLRLGSDGTTWAGTGITGTEAAAADGVGGTGADPLALAPAPLAPTGLLLTAPQPAPGGWVASAMPVLEPDEAGSAVPTTGLWRSADAVRWEPLGEVTGAAYSAAYLLVPAVSATAAPSAAAAAPAAPSAITIAGTALVAVTSGVETEFPYEHAASSAVELLTEALGPPVTEAIVGDGYCSADGVGYRWDGLALRHDGDDPAAAIGWWVQLTGPAGTPVTAVTGPEGLGVGEELGAVLARLTEPQTESWSYQGQLWERVMVDVAGEKGVEVMGIDGVVSVVSAPVWVVGDC